MEQGEVKEKKQKEREEREREKRRSWGWLFEGLTRSVWCLKDCNICRLGLGQVKKKKKPSC